jgi:hypothetical protein
MIGRFVLPLVALIGFAVAVGMVKQGNQTAPVAPPVVQSPKVPFASYVAGNGIIEASTENIAIGTPVSGIVAAIYVNLGDRVTGGNPSSRSTIVICKAGFWLQPPRSGMPRRMWQRLGICSNTASD